MTHHTTTNQKGKEMNRQDYCELRGITPEDSQHPDLIKQNCKGCGYWYFKADLIAGYCCDCDQIKENE